jgi:hypothetical protein
MNPDDSLNARLLNNSVAYTHSVDRSNDRGSQGLDENLSDMQSVANLSDAMRRPLTIRLDQLTATSRTDHGATAMETAPPTKCIELEYVKLFHASPEIYPQPRLPPCK